MEGIANFLNVDMSYYDINTIFRMNNKSKKIPSIIIGFHSKILRDQILNAYLKKPTMKLNDISMNGSTQRVYLNEHLTTKYSSLMKKARDLRSSGLLSKIYSRNGIPFVVKTGESTATRIFSEMDLNNCTNPVTSRVNQSEMEAGGDF